MSKALKRALLIGAATQVPAVYLYGYIMSLAPSMRYSEPDWPWYWRVNFVVLLGSMALLTATNFVRLLEVKDDY